MKKNFLLLSDIHACDVDPASSSAPSYVSSFASSSSGKPDPIDDLHRIIAQEGISPDFILCAGDITNRSNPASLSYAWEKLNKFAQKYDAKLISTVGNHDLDSRYNANKFDPKGYAMSLGPTIPVPEREKYLEFWAENFTHIAVDNANIVVLNTAAYHGGGKTSDTELEHGRISEITISLLRKRIATIPPQPINILLCHHHPIKGEATDLELTGLTRGGEQLIETLAEDEGSWIIVHGHKHVPDVFYGYGGGNAPTVIACASFSAQVNTDAQNKNPNQVHFLTCDPDGASAAQLNNAGVVRSWTWQQGVGWRKAQANQGLPQKTGFGFRGSAKALAAELDGHLTALGVTALSWKDAASAVPNIDRLIPKDFDVFAQVLLSKYQITILTDRDGSLAQVGRS